MNILNKKEHIIDNLIRKQHHRQIMQEYFYHLGHQSGLSEYELQALYSQTHNTAWEGINDRVWAVGSPIDTPKWGSIVFDGEVISSSLNFDILESDAHAYLKENPEGLKKIGIWFESKKESHNLISQIKKYGYKNVNVLPGFKNIQYGHWKSCKHWFIIFRLKDTFYFGKIKNMADQQTWTIIDESLDGDMKRGLMNLKLCRTLLNLAHNNIIWDPFCGHGRIATAGLDLDKQFISSDLDRSCLQDVQRNFDEASFHWKKRHPINSTLLEVWQQDAQDHEKLSEMLSSLNLVGNQVSIVTEGYLGVNPGRYLTQEEMTNQWTHIKRIWINALMNYAKVNIPEIIFCIPSYATRNSSAFLKAQWLEQVVKESKYTLIKRLHYSRRDSYVGHEIIILALS